MRTAAVQLFSATYRTPWVEGYLAETHHALLHHALHPRALAGRFVSTVASHSMLVDLSGAPQDNLCLVAPVAQALPPTAFGGGGAFTHFVGSNGTWDALTGPANEAAAAQAETATLAVRAPGAHVHVVAAIVQPSGWTMINTNPATAAAEPLEDGSATGAQVQIEAGGAARLAAALQEENEVTAACAFPLRKPETATERERTEAHPARGVRPPVRDPPPRHSARDRPGKKGR